MIPEEENLQDDNVVQKWVIFIIPILLLVVIIGFAGYRYSISIQDKNGITETGQIKGLQLVAPSPLNSEEKRTLLDSLSKKSVQDTASTALTSDQKSKLLNNLSKPNQKPVSGTVLTSEEKQKLLESI